MHNTSQQSFGDRLRRYRVAAGLSQEALAERAGIAARTIGAIEQGTSTAPYKGTVQCLAHALAIPDMSAPLSWRSRASAVHAPGPPLPSFTLTRTRCRRPSSNWLPATRTQAP